MSSYGKPIQVLEFINNKPHIRDECLKEVFRHPKVTSECKKVIIISMAGDQGVGKSFLLNLCLSYLKYMEKHKSVDSNKWINEADTLPLDGFKWENNAREGGTTVGILLWSEPFLFPLEDGSEVAVFLMDTQGNFDCKEVIENNGIVYGCSTLISSIQIYNISKKMRSYDYEHLVVLSDYGVHATEQREKLFQKLIILMRDWESPDYEYGESGGLRYRDEVLFLINNQTEDVRQYKSRVRKIYESVACYLMPHPGQGIARSKNSRECDLTKMEAEFRTELSRFMNWIFGADNINSHNSKRINGRNITASEIPFYFKSYFESFNKQKDTKDTKLKMEEYENANNIANIMGAVETAYQVYWNKMNAEFNILTTWREETIRKIHNKNSEEAMKLFHSIPKLGDESFVKEYEKMLQNLLDTALKQILNQKDFKNAAIAIAAIGGGILAGVTIATLSGPAALIEGFAILIATGLKNFKPS